MSTKVRSTSLSILFGILSLLGAQPVFAAAEITLDKTGMGEHGAGYDAPGEILYYTYEVENTGDVILAGPATIVDDMAVSLTCPDLVTVGPTYDGNLDLAETVVCTGLYYITQDDIDDGSVTNNATATVGGQSDSDSVTLNVEPLGLVMTGSGPDNSYDELGDVLTYHYEVTNHTAGTLGAPVVLVESLATTGVSCDPIPGGTFEAGESLTCTSNYTVVQADLDNGAVTNVASVSVGGTVTQEHDVLLVYADPDLPGVKPNLETIPEDSLIIPMDTINQAIGKAFNLKAYGLVNKLLQNNIPVKWAIRSNKVKLRGTATLTDGTGVTLEDTAADFSLVKAGDFVTNADDGYQVGIVTAPPVSPFTELTIDPVDSLDWSAGDEYSIDGHDFSGTVVTMLPTPDAAEVSRDFAGGVFIVSYASPTNVADALLIAGDFGNDVVVYQAAEDLVDVDIRYTLTHKPFMAISDIKTDIHVDVMEAAGIPGNPGYSDKMEDNCIPPGTEGHDSNVCNWNVVNPVDLGNLECATLHLEPHRDKPTAEDDILAATLAVKAFVLGGGNFLAQCHATLFFENLDQEATPQPGQFMTEYGIIKGGNTQDFLDFPNAPLPFSQIVGPLNGGQGGSVKAWQMADDLGDPAVDPDGAYVPPGHVHARDPAAIPLEDRYYKAAATKLLLGPGTGGNVFYLGGHTYGGESTTALDDINGMRMLLNTVFVPVDRPEECGLNFADPMLTLVKEVTNDNGGNAVVGDWTLSATGPTPISGVTGDPAVTAATVLEGTYTLDETGPDGYTAGSWSCDGGVQVGDELTLAPLDNVTCTIVNNDDAPGLTLLKSVTNNYNGGAVPGSFQLRLDGGAYTNAPYGSGATPPVMANTEYTLSEDALAGYSSTGVTCVDDDTGGPEDHPVTLNEGQSVTCTIGNVDIEPQLTLVKDVTIDNSGDAEPGDFTLRLNGGDYDGSTAFSSGATPAVMAKTAYTLSEDAYPGYVNEGVTCVDDDTGGPVGHPVRPNEGQSVTCTISNNDAAPGLTLLKSVTSNNGGGAQPGDFTLRLNGGDYDGSTAFVSGATPAVAANTLYTLSEDTLTGYAQSGDVVCLDGDSGADVGHPVKLDEGRSVNCTITNDDQPPSLTLAKTVTNNHFGSAGDTDWTLTATGPTTISGVEGDAAITAAVVNAGVYTLTESPGPAGYTMTGWACTGMTDSTLVGNTLTLALDEDVTCTVTNEDLPPDINLAKTTVDSPAVLQPDGSYTVVYTIRATNNGTGIGKYDLDDVFSPGTGITLNTAVAVYVGGSENDQGGKLGVYPQFVDDEPLGIGLYEEWTVTANFTVDPVQVSPNDRYCDPGSPVEGTGFYNRVTGVVKETDTTDNDTCTRLPDPQINLAKQADPAINVGSGIWEVTYTVTATNWGYGPGVYDIMDSLEPGDGITLIEDASYPAIAYNSGETQTGILTPPPLTNGGLWVAAEALAGRASENWTITARFAVDLEYLLANQASANCTWESGETGTGYHNFVEGSTTDLDLSDNEACVPHILPNIAVPALNGFFLLIMALMLMATGWYFRPASLRKW